jgi:hypothetical protein
MPQVFEKDSEINVIEYGDHCFKPLTVKGVWEAFTALFKAA